MIHTSRRYNRTDDAYTDFEVEDKEIRIKYPRVLNLIPAEGYIAVDIIEGKIKRTPLLGFAIVETLEAEDEESELMTMIMPFAFDTVMRNIDFEWMPVLILTPKDMLSDSMIKFKYPHFFSKDI